MKPSKTEVDDELERIIKAPAVPIEIKYADWRPRMVEKITEGEWAQSNSIRAKMRRLIGGK